jgi:hypothetical protein
MANEPSGVDAVQQQSRVGADAQSGLEALQERVLRLEGRLDGGLLRPESRGRNVWHRLRQVAARLGQVVNTLGGGSAGGIQKLGERMTLCGSLTCQV